MWSNKEKKQLLRFSFMESAVTPQTLYPPMWHFLSGATKGRPAGGGGLKVTEFKIFDVKKA